MQEYITLPVILAGLLRLFSGTCLPGGMHPFFLSHTLIGDLQVLLLHMLSYEGIYRHQQHNKI